MPRKLTYEELEHKVDKLNQVEDALRDSEERFRLIAETSPDYIYQVDTEGTIIYVSPAVEQILEYEPDELIGTNFINLAPPSSVSETLEKFQTMLSEKRRGIFELQLLNKSGNIINTETHASIMVKEGKLIGVQGVTRDITERKESEKALRESEENYRELANSLPQTVFETDDKGNLQFVNLNAFDVFGYTKKDFEKGLNALQMLISEDHDRALENMQRVLKGEALGGIEYTAIKNNGETFPILIHANRILRENIPAGLRGIIVDLTERKQAEEVLRDNEQRFKRLAESTFEGILLHEEAKVIDMNKTFATMFGYDQSELIGMDAMRLVSPESIEVVRENIRKEYEEPYEAIGLRKDGSAFIMEIKAKMIDSKGGRIRVAACRDITEQKRAEDALKQSEEKYRILIEESPLGVSLIDKSGQYIYINPRFIEMFGYSLEHIRTGRDWFRKAFPDKKYRQKVISTWITDKHDYGVGESRTRMFVVICLDGSEKTINFRPVTLDTGDQLVIYEDITETKQLEDQLRQAQKMEAIGTLAGGIAHDFNNLLMGMQGRTSLMLLGKDSSHPGFEHLKGIEDNIKSAADLTKQLLGFARGGKYEVQSTNLNEIVNKSTDMFGRARKEITIHKKLQKEIWTVEVDQTQIEQVLLNLYVNAWQAMSRGGTLYLETENVTLGKTFVKPYAVTPGKFLKISVTDTGAGMDEATQKRIFDPFFTTKEISRGTGLGLASAYGIIKNHNGIINVSSKKDKGTTFNIYLPASEKEIAKGKEITEEVIKGTETILLIDDEEMIIEVGKEMLENLGYTVLSAKSGKEAITTYQKDMDRIEGVILDMVMPGMGGSETYDRLKAINPDIKVLLSSGYNIDGLAKTILAKGCDGFIQKPFSLEDLSKKLRELLDNE